MTHKVESAELERNAKHPDDIGTVQRGGKSSNTTGNQSIWCFSSWSANNLHGLMARACSYEPVILKSLSRLCQCNFAPLSSSYMFELQSNWECPSAEDFSGYVRVLAPSSSQHQEEGRDLCSRDQDDSETTLCAGSQVSCGTSGSGPCLWSPGPLLPGLSPLFPSHPSALLPSLWLENAAALGLLQLSTCMSWGRTFFLCTHIVSRCKSG